MGHELTLYERGFRRAVKAADATVLKIPVTINFWPRERYNGP
jgi:hypothetical protein